MSKINKTSNNQKTQVSTNIPVANFEYDFWSNLQFLKENTTNSSLEFNFGNGTMDTTTLGNIDSDEFEQELRGY
jgi:hypothetical protein